MSDPEQDPDLEAIERELHDAVAQVFNGHGLMVTKWMLIVEGLDGSGERSMESYTSPDYRSWDSVGFLGFLDARERGVIGAAAAREILGDE